ncbi:diguanylate cyclase [Dechloromonas denitrificans]|uniref:diguanylate cyclase n=1 Tax=Dechloromonas denitrificans TaxID=281362 RepID=UPI001CF8836F|nr:diguanylate cyclase [Dechloromonas denitrificans]UCV11778.1 diguanylate cyclase [Dechloromonas denitrificans]
MNQITLRQRLLLLTLLPSTLIAIALVAYFTYSGINTLEAELRTKGLSTVRYLAPISEYSIISGQIESLHSLAQATVQDSGVKAAIIVNQKGRAMAVSGRVSLSGEILRQTPDGPRQVAENDRWVAFGAPVVRSLNEADSLFEPLHPEQKGSPPEVIGHVFVEFDKTELNARQADLFQRGLIIVLVGLILLAVLAIAIADTLAKPLHQLALAVRQMSSGHFGTRVNATSSGELGILEHGFNEMANHIEEVHRSMQSRIEEATAQLAFQARHDPLTGLFNRREFEHRLDRALSSVQAGGDEFSVLFIDLDRFKPVNDTCGHLAGDELLRQISQLFQGRLREEDSLARLGGDEFGVLLANCSGQRARQVADDICGLAAAYRFIWQDKVFAIGASIGLASVNRRVRNITEILAAGDAACYRAKESGRNQVCEQETLNTQERRQEPGNWASRISIALADDRLILEALPLAALQDDVVTGHLVEIGARLNEPGQPPIALSALMDAAERYDLAPTIDLRFIDCAIAALARAKQAQRTLHCLVPISRASLGQSKVVEHIARGLASHNLPGSGLCLLFSEDVSTHQSSQIPEFLRQIRILGCQVGLSDFGGGLSSFSHLHTISPSYIKLSTSLTRDLGGNRASTALLRAVQEITADLGIYSIAENIDETPAIEQLKALGISYAQGKAIAPCEPFEVWLEGAVMR